MKDPERWLESEDAPDASLELLRVARGPTPLSDAARTRSRRRVAALAALPAAATVGWWPALALGAVIGAASSMAVQSALTPPPPSPPPSVAISTAPPRSPLVSPAESTVTPPPEPPDTAPRASEAIPTARLPAVSTPSSATPSKDALEREIALLERARRSLASNPDAARRALLEHEQRYPAGQLRVEREFLLVDALVRLGRRSEAEARAAALEVLAPKSLYGERLDRILGRAPR